MTVPGPVENAATDEPFWITIQRSEYDALLAKAEAGAEGDKLLGHCGRKLERAEAERDAAVRAAEQAQKALRRAGTSLDAIIIGYRESLPRDVVTGLTALRERIARAALTGEETIPDPIVSNREPTEAQFEHARKLSKQRGWKDVRP